MAKDDRSASALAAAKRLYERKPDASTEEFRKVCEKADQATIGNLDNREFNASYVLPFRRSAALRGRSTKKKTKRSKAGRPRGGARGGARGGGRGGGRGGARGRARGGARVSNKVARLVHERDAEIMAAANDPQKAYEAAAGVHDFIDELLKAAGR